MARSLLVALAVGFAVMQLANLVTTVWLHRTLSHRALTLSPIATWVCRVLLWVTTGIRPRQWVAVHRKHHANTDVEGDPHSPVLAGFMRVQLLNVVMYRRCARDPATVARYARDLPPDRWDRALFDHGLLGLALGVGLLVVVLGPLFAAVAAATHVVVYLLGSAAVNAVGHRFGRHPHPNRAGNVGWLAWLTAGEGWHNNHHAAPTSARLGLGRGQVDFGWWAVRLLRSCGAARVRHVETRLKRPVAA
ncbi:MAG: acyl-CoA desaturase [Acidimicrobiales bacterium]